MKIFFLLKMKPKTRRSNSFDSYDFGTLSEVRFLEEQCRIYQKIFNKIGLPCADQSLMFNYKIPKRTGNFGFLTMTDKPRKTYLRESYTQKSIVVSDFNEPPLQYNLPPDHHWSIVFHWPWPRVTNSTRSSSSSDSLSGESQSPVRMGYAGPAKLVQQMKPYHRKSVINFRTHKPRFRFNSDRNHELSDDEDASTSIHPSIPSKIPSWKRSRFGRGGYSRLERWKAKDRWNNGPNAFSLAGRSKFDECNVLRFPTMAQTVTFTGFGRTDFIRNTNQDGNSNGMEINDEEEKEEDEDNILIVGLSDTEMEF